jgi:3-isopropylmalate/(R)-2-methylmalate dehydratase small subunit|tara:strand:+ start:9155 stop:9649 length:495 start_codon:yes stop_codon:yes gene_type:complete
MSGRVWKFGDNISTDLIASGRYFHLRSNLPELAKHVLEDARPEFATEVKLGDFIVTGENFGLGSSREHAPRIIKLSGIVGIMSSSFARIFFRNCINIGLPAIICDTSIFDDGNIVDVDLEQGKAKNITKNIETMFNPLPKVMTKILKDGGLVEHIKKNGDFKLR